MRKKHPTRVIEEAVKGMLPKTKLGRAMFQKLKVYAGDKHPHQAQKPQPVRRGKKQGESLSAQAIDYYATGKRKTAIARVHLRPGTGEIQLNDKSMDDYFGGHEALKMLVKQPFAITEMVEKFDVQREPRTAAAFGPGRRAAPRDLEGPVRVQPRAAQAAQEGGVPDPRRAHQGAQEVRTEGRAAPLPVQQALTT